MTALTAQKETGRDWDFRTLATDLDTSMLKKAKAGIYPRASLESVPAGVRERYFDKPAGGHDNVLVAKAAQEMISFRQLNLLGPWPMSGKFDVIFCRNVMIYFDCEARQRVVSMLERHLAPGGYLFLSHSEGLSEIAHGLRWCVPGVYRRAGA